MAVIRVATNFNIDLEFTAAPFGKRLIAWALDLLLQIFYILIAFRFLRWLMLRLDPSIDNDYNLWAIMLLLMLPFFMYHFTCEVLMNGQSIGKRIVAIRVVTTGGGRPALSQLVIRWLIRTSDYTVLILLLYAPYTFVFGKVFFSAIGASLLLLFADIILVNVTKTRQRLGDILAHTVLISTLQSATIYHTLFMPVTETYVPRFRQVMQLTDRDINSLKRVLDAATKRQDFELADRAAAKIKNHLSIQTEISAFEFLEILLNDYNYLATR